MDRQARLGLAVDVAEEVGAAAALEAFAAAWDGRYPAIIRLWRAHWNEFIPFLVFPPEVRQVIYTTCDHDLLRRADPDP